MFERGYCVGKGKRRERMHRGKEIGVETKNRREKSLKQRVGNYKTEKEV